MPQRQQPSPRAEPAGRERGHTFGLYFCACGASELASQIGVVAVGWQVYALTGSPVALGLVGLAQFLPNIALTLVAGHAADNYDRRRVVQICQAIEGLTAAFLAWGSVVGWLNVIDLFAAVAVLGAAEAFKAPAAAAMLSAVAPGGRLQKATALTTGAFQAAAIGGPALGGLLYTVTPAAPYVSMAALGLLAAALSGATGPLRSTPSPDGPTTASVFAGIDFVWRNPAILGTISLDLFAVLLGGVTTLLPIFARDILHTGPWGLGLLRAAPAIGALAVAAALARWPIERRAGLRMFQAVIVFGLATIVFALSRSIWLSILALTALGAADMVSMVIRIALVQLATPDAMRGRVGAVNFLFVGASYQLGGVESGLTAALFGAAPAALLGGVGTVAVALLWMRLFPALRKVERLEQHDGASPPAD